MENGVLRDPKTGQFEAKNELPSVVISFRLSAEDYEKALQAAEKDKIFSVREMARRLLLKKVTGL